MALRTRRSTARIPRSTATSASATHAGRVVAVHDDGRTCRVELEPGAPIDAAIPQHVNPEWLRAASAVAPVEAVVMTSPSGRLLLVGVYAGPEHAAVEVNLDLTGAIVSIRAREAFTLRCQGGSITIDKRGHVTVRGKELVSRASGANIIKGGRVELN